MPKTQIATQTEGTALTLDERVALTNERLTWLMDLAKDSPQVLDQLQMIQQEHQMMHSANKAMVSALEEAGKVIDGLTLTVQDREAFIYLLQREVDIERSGGMEVSLNRVASEMTRMFGLPITDCKRFLETLIGKWDVGTWHEADIRTTASEVANFVFEEQIYISDVGDDDTAEIEF